MWSKKEDDREGLQIDLLIKRNDNVINMCEIKFYNRPFQDNKEYYSQILTRESILSEMISKRTAIHSTLITTFGLVNNEYSSAFLNTIVLDDLFK